MLRETSSFILGVRTEAMKSIYWGQYNFHLQNLKYKKKYLKRRKFSIHFLLLNFLHVKLCHSENWNNKFSQKFFQCKRTVDFPRWNCESFWTKNIKMRERLQHTACTLHTNIDRIEMLKKKSKKWTQKEKKKTLIFIFAIQRQCQFI